MEHDHASLDERIKSDVVDATRWQPLIITVIMVVLGAVGIGGLLAPGG